MTITEIFIIFLLIVVAFSFIFNFALFVYFFFFNVLSTLFLGAFFAKSDEKIVEKMVLLSNPKPGERTVDLGSGDGRIVIALAKAGAEAHGYEVNPILVWLSKKKIKKAGLKNKAFVHLGNFWFLDFSKFDIVTVYGISYIMRRLEKKLQRELKPGARVVSNYFTFPNWQPAREIDKVYLYEK